MEKTLSHLTLGQLYQALLQVANSKSVFILISIFFRLTLELGYWIYVHPLHSYSGFSWNLDLIKYFESWCLFIIFVILAPCRINKPSDFFINILLFGLMAPLLSFYGLADQSRKDLYIVILGYALLSIYRKGRLVRFPVLREGRLLGLVLIGATVLCVSAWFIASGGLAYFNLDLTEVYKYRRTAGKVIHSGSMGYINTWAWKVFGPALLAIALWHKKYWLAILTFALHVFWFGVSAHKAVLFYPFLVFFLWFWLRRTNASSVFPFALILVLLFSIFAFYVLSYALPASLFIRRAFYVVAKNTFDYYEFFTNNPLIWWSNSSVTFGLLDYPYDIDPAKLIGRWRGTEAHVNNTFLSTGYMHAGILGIIVYGIVAGFIFRLIDSFALRGIPIWLSLSVVVAPSRSLLLSADLPTSILTHGIGIGIVLLFLIRQSNQHIQTKQKNLNNHWIKAFSLK